MKFFALVALLGTVASLRLTQNGHGIRNALAQIKDNKNLHNELIKRKTTHFMKSRWEELTPEQVGEIEAWVEYELTTGEKTITKQEAHDAIIAFGEKHGFPPLSEEDWEELEAWFDDVDSNGDGALDLDELMAEFQ